MPRPQSYHQRQSMGAALIVDNLELAPVSFGTRLPTSEGWEAELVEQCEEIGRFAGKTSTGM